MRSRAPSSINLKAIFLCCSFFVFLLLLFIRNGSYSSPPNPISTTNLPQTNNPNHKSGCPSDPLNPTCTKMPPSLADALIHYVTTNITPQQTLGEISVSKRVLERRSPCNFLVFGLGHDSLMWASLNYGGRTVFLEEDKSWIRAMGEKFPGLESHHVVYNTKVKESEKLMEMGKAEEGCRSVIDPRNSRCELALKGLPEFVYETEWDVIMVDAPTGYHEEAPGRMSAIFTAGLMGRNREEGETDVFVHDVDRVVEDRFSWEFLCEGYMREQHGRIRHFTIPSHKTRAARPFCPVIVNPTTTTPRHRLLP